MAWNVLAPRRASDLLRRARRPRLWLLLDHRLGIGERFALIRNAGRAVRHLQPDTAIRLKTVWNATGMAPSLIRAAPASQDALGGQRNFAARLTLGEGAITCGDVIASAYAAPAGGIVIELEPACALAITDTMRLSDAGRIVMSPRVALGRDRQIVLAAGIASLASLQLASLESATADQALAALGPVWLRLAGDLRTAAPAAEIARHATWSLRREAVTAWLEATGGTVSGDIATMRRSAASLDWLLAATTLDRQAVMRARLAWQRARLALALGNETGDVQAFGDGVAAAAEARAALSAAEVARLPEIAMLEARLLLELGSRLGDSHRLTRALAAVAPLDTIADPVLAGERRHLRDEVLAAIEALELRPKVAPVALGRPTPRRQPVPEPAAGNRQVELRETDRQAKQTKVHAPRPLAWQGAEPHAAAVWVHAFPRPGERQPVAPVNPALGARLRLRRLEVQRGKPE